MTDRDRRDARMHEARAFISRLERIDHQLGVDFYRPIIIGRVPRKAHEPRPRLHLLHSGGGHPACLTVDEQRLLAGLEHELISLVIESAIVNGRPYCPFPPHAAEASRA
jgi:hypothetical protein